MNQTFRAAFLAAISTLALFAAACPVDDDGDENGAGNSAPKATLITRTLSGIDVNLCYVPPGRFQRDGYASNVSVITRGFWLAQTETTQELFQAVMAHNPSFFHGESGREPVDGETQSLRPVEQVNWYHAIAFCNKLSLANDKEPVYSVKIDGAEIPWEELTWSQIPQTGNSDWNAASMDVRRNGYRLPTEMEWMWAAMGAERNSPANTTGRNKSFAGSNGSNERAEYVWYISNSGGKTHEAGIKSANELELLDMSGNVREWCWDWHSSYPNGTVSDYEGAGIGDYRAVRGGGFDSSTEESKLSFRGDWNLSAYSDDALGFRFACTGD